MEFKSLQEFIRIVENALSVQFYGQSSLLRKSVLKVLASVVGAMLYMMSLIAKRIYKNRFVSTCDVSALEGFGVEYGVPHKVPLAAAGDVTVELNDGVSSVTIPQDTVLVDQAAKLAYSVKATTVIDSDNTKVPVIALEVGYDYNLDAGTVLEFRDDPVAGVKSLTSVNVSGGVAEGVEIDGDVFVWGESAEEYRARLLNRVQNPPHGGSANDYWQMATRFSFVDEAYVIPNIPQSNSVCIALANYKSSDIYLTPAQVEEVSNYITDDVRRPITADVRVFSVTPVNVTVTAYVAPYNDSVRSSVANCIKAYFRQVKPGSTVSFGDLEDVVRSNSTAKTFTVQSAKKGNTFVDSLSFTLDVSNMYQSVAQVAKLTDSSIVLLNGGT